MMDGTQEYGIEPECVEEWFQQVWKCMWCETFFMVADSKYGDGYRGIMKPVYCPMCGKKRVKEFPTLEEQHEQEG